MESDIFIIWLGILIIGSVLVAVVPSKVKAFLGSLFIAAALIYGIGIFKLENLSIPNLVFPTAGINVDVFGADGFAFYMAIVVLAVSLLIAIYSYGYMSDEKHLSEFYSLFLLFVASMLGLMFSFNLIPLYIFWELTAFCSWRLIGLRRGEEHLSSANQAMLITSFGAVAMLAGIALIYKDTGSFSLSALKGYQPSLAVSILLLLGIFSKSAQVPLHLWLPDAGVAPTPVTALLHAAVLVKIGVYAYFRLFNATMLLNPSLAYWVGIFAVGSALISAGAAAKEKDIKRILAYSTISQLSYIMFAFSLNTSTAVMAGFIYILAHSFSKAGLFLVAGVVEHYTHTKDITKLGGLKKIMPLTNIAFIACALSIIGIPPTVGFFAKYSVISSALDSHRFYSAILLLGGAMMTMYYLMRLYKNVFTGELSEVTHTLGSSGEKSFSMKIVVALFGLISVILGLMIKFPTEILSKLL